MTRSIDYVSLKAHIEGLPKKSDFEFRQVPLPKLEKGQFITENHYISVDPGMRLRLSGVETYAPPLKPGDMISGFIIGRVLDSQNAAYEEGDMVTMSGNWASHSLSNGDGFVFKLPEIDIPTSLFLGVLGIPGMASYFGLKRVGRFQQGDHVLVTSASGPVGATAGQLAKQWGAASVTGIAGSDAKCEWLVEKAGFDAAINYKTENDLAGAISAACPSGIDILFDNVGNAMIDTIIPMLRLNGRIIVSGQTADYSIPLDARHGIKNTTEFIGNRLMMQGFVVFDDIPQFPEAQKEMSTLIRNGNLIFEEEIFEGLEALPAAFCGLFKGENFGRRLVKVGA